MHEDVLKRLSEKMIFAPGQKGREIPAWLSRALRAFAENVLHPHYPCFFGTRALNANMVYCSYVDGRGMRHVSEALAYFLDHCRVNPIAQFAVFFEPATLLTHENVRDRFWAVLKDLQDSDPQNLDAGRPAQAVDPDHPAWEFTFRNTQMFVVGISPTYRARRSRNLGDCMIMLFQPREVFDLLTETAGGGARARAQIRQRLRLWDGIAPHRDLGVYGERHNREWKQYFLPDDGRPVTGRCPLSSAAQPSHQNPASEQGTADGTDTEQEDPR